MYSLAWPATNTRPMTSVIVYQKRSPKTSPCSAANTPIWQVNELATRIAVNTVA